MHRLELIPFLLALAFAAGCDFTDPLVAITSPRDGDTIALTAGDVTLHLKGHELDMSGGMDLYVDGRYRYVDWSSTFSSCVSDCVFMAVFDPSPLAPGSHTIEVMFEYDLTTIASDKVTLNFVAP